VNKLLLAAIAGLAAGTAWAEPAPSPNGLSLPQDYRDWRVIAVSQRTESGTLRAVLGNEAAVAAARAGQTRPWPDGAILAKVAWKQKTHEHFPTAVVPGEFSHVDIMIKDAAKYAATGGWGFARWTGETLAPYGKSPDFAQECLGCHGAAAASDRVFTVPARLP
jgi:hypothetical protein